MKLKTRNPLPPVLFLRLLEMNDTSARPALKLGFGLRFEDLYETEGLERVDAVFFAHLEKVSPELAALVRSARENPAALT